jgi:hypothetical protein
MKKTVNNVFKKLSIERRNKATSGILKLLNNTILGTPGKLRYKQTQIEQTINSFKNLEFIEIKKGNRVLGTTGIIERDISLGKNYINALYVRYLSIYSPFKRGKSKLNKLPKKPKGNSKLREQITQLFSSEFEEQLKNDSKPGVLYAYVEHDNILSKNLCKSFGFKEVRTIFTILFSRLSPSKSHSVSILSNESGNEFKDQLEKFYSDHNFVFTADIENHGIRFIYKKGNQTVAGLRAISINWKIIEIPGIKGFFMQQVLPKIPYFNRIFDPERLRFIAFDSIWYKDGFSGSITEMMEHACSELDINMGMIWLDKRSNITQQLLDSGKLGLLHRVNGIVNAELMQRSINLSKEDEIDLLSKPAFVSAVDMT